MNISAFNGLDDNKNPVYKIENDMGVVKWTLSGTKSQLEELRNKMPITVTNKLINSKHSSLNHLNILIRHYDNIFK